MSTRPSTLAAPPQTGSRDDTATRQTARYRRSLSALDDSEEEDIVFRAEEGGTEEEKSSRDAGALTPKMVLKIALMAMLYYPLSITLTFYQKWFIKNYKLPLTVVCGHYVTKWLLAVVIRAIFECFKNRRIRLSMREQLRWLAPIGVCASLDIGLSNWALEYVTVSLYTMAKSSSIVFIVFFSILMRLERFRVSLAAEAALIALGLFLFTWKSAQLDLGGLMLVELAAVCTGVRWTVSQFVMQRDDQAVRHPLDMVAHVQPWMMLPIVPLIAVFEGSELTFDRLAYYGGEFAPLKIAWLIFIGGTIAFLMELSEYLLLVHTSGITLSIFGIVKEVMTLLLAARVNGDKLSAVNIVGLVLCLGGMALHSLTRPSRSKTPASIVTGTGSPTASSAIQAADDRRRLLDCEGH